VGGPTCPRNGSVTLLTFIIITTAQSSCGLRFCAGTLNAPNDYFLFVASDNDFVTQSGYMAGQTHSDSSGANADTLTLAYRVTLPTYVPPAP
jgi:hypothetical protein